MRTPLITIFLALVAVLCLGAGRAEAQADYVGTRALGMGEALRANAAGASAILLNPSGMSLSRGYVVEAGYGIRVEDVGHHAFVAIVDSVTSRVAAGLYYEYIHANPKLGFDWAGGRVADDKLTRSGHAAGISLSIALGERFLLGASVKYLHFDTNAPLPAGTHPSKLSLDHINGVTFDVGATFKLHPKFQIAAVGYNLWNHGSRETPTSAGFGLSFIPIPTLLINFDGVANFTGYKTLVVTDDPSVVKYKFKPTGRFGPGIEWLIASKVPVRAGFVYDTGLNAAYVTAGTGYFGQSFAVDLSYRGKVTGGVENFLMIGLRLFIN
ncbi:MAG: hypothetical protein ABI321_00530 [Polyangia bacterium]